MYIVVVTVHVKPEHRFDFIREITANAIGTRTETGNVRFDVIRGEEDPNRFLLYEVYKSKDDFAKHQQTEHYLKWKNAVTDWMAQPRTSTKNTAVFFGDGII